MTNKYDLTLVLNAEVKDEVKDKFVDKTEKVLKALDGSVVRTQDMGRKQLAYKIKNQSEGIYLNMQLEMPAASVIQLDKKLSVDKEVLRYLLVKVSE
ncbi:30S ribosomal protein S6 [Candidatus Amesbacteria bacterium RIFOXYB1_FULL_44_23]|uniref:Small ribosomal subunit protein bS6 n=1 Tax=Candidatus Amesbacteria bacterium RIFOXYB1_FULL_44_23 TaxID=1797263 RepID=A0A1F4ZTF8_9BACT|nr:MAG: 30S ribosomal protein S6 [Candidatus Amesbacteria bacterium RIFOXYB1_FULL_44_23]